jgi:predicted ATP-dependent endonuclease of OLD family
MYTLLFKDINNPDIFNDYYLFEEKESFSFFPKTNKINIILGSNNSGKSRFIRRLMNSNSFIGINEYNIESHNNIVNEINKEFIRKTNSNRILNKLYINHTAEELLKKNSQQVENYSGYISMSKRNDFKEIIDKTILDFSKKKKYYIPTLRTAHSLFLLTKSSVEKSIYDDSGNDFKKIEDDIYLHTYQKNYIIDKKIKIFTGLHLYREILNSRNSKRETRLQFEKFQDFISDNFFEKKKIDIVAEFKKEDNISGKNVSEIISIDIQGEKEPRDLHNLGDGIQALIILMYQIFMADNESIIFIDEPELNLHPGMQRLFLEQISKNKILEKKNLTYFITTHSNHFLDLTIEKNDVSMYSFSQKLNEDGEKKFIIKNVNCGDNEILRTLGVNNSSVFMANCSIWVEGISDRNYIKAFLKSYCDSIGKPYPKEDIDFAFFEYAGSNYSHYNFSDEIDETKIKAFALNNKILLTSDIDAGKIDKHQALFKIAKENFQYTTTEPFREIENVFPNRIWEKVLIEFRNKKSYKIDVDNEIQNKISKALEKHNYEDYKENYIGVFLKKLKISELNKIWDGTDTKPQTFAYKADLSNLILEKVINKSIKWDDFKVNPTIIKFTEEIYNFITQKE